MALIEGNSVDGSWYESNSKYKRNTYERLPKYVRYRGTLDVTQSTEMATQLTQRVNGKCRNFGQYKITTNEAHHQ